VGKGTPRIWTGIAGRVAAISLLTGKNSRERSGCIKGEEGVWGVGGSAAPDEKGGAQDRGSYVESKRQRKCERGGPEGEGG